MINMKEPQKQSVAAEELALRETLTRNQALLSALPDLMFILNKDGVYQDYKAGGYGDLFEAQSDFLGKRVDEVLTPDFSHFSIRCIKRALKSRNVEIFEYPLEIDGELYIYECRMNAIDDSNVIVIARDITELRLEVEKFRAIIETAPDPLLVINTEGCIMLVNNQIVKHFGYTLNDLNGKNFEILIPERFRRTHLQHVRKYLLKPTVRPMGSGLELFALHKDGSEFPVEISLSPFEAHEGMMIIASIRDITFRKQVERDLAKYQAHLELLVADQTKEISLTREYLDELLLNMPAGVAILEGEDFIYSKINQNLAEINGLSIEDHLGKKLRDVLPQAAEFIIPRLQSVFETGKASEANEFKTRVPKKQDEDRWFWDRFFSGL